MRGNCKECPWVVKSQNNLSITKHAQLYGKVHNCHMIAPEKRGDLWDTKKGCECIGARDTIGNIDKLTDKKL